MEKIKFILCDDDPCQLEALKIILEEICQEEGLLYSIECYSDGEKLLESYKEPADIIFMDIEMPLMDGLETARRLRLQDTEATLIFTTSHEKYAIKGYQVDAWRYFIKPIGKRELKIELLPRLCSLSKRKNAVLYLKTENGAETIDPGKILYIETLLNHRLAIHLEDRTLEAYRSMSQLQEKLDATQFFRCHTSYIINFQAVLKIEHNDIIMKDQKVIPLSKHRRREFLDAFLRFAKEAF